MVGEAVRVSGLRLTGPHAACVLESGRAAPVRAGEEVVGIFFEGSGSFEYLSADPIEAPVVVFDAKKGSSLKPEKTDAGIRLRDTVKRMLWLARGQPLPELSGAAAAPLADAFRREREKFGRMHAPPPSHDFAIQALDAPEAPLVWAEIEGGREDLLYVFDGTDDPSEGLATLHPSESDEKELRKFLWLAPLSLQPIGRDPRDPPPARFSLTDVGVELTASAGNEAKLSVEQTLVPRGRPARALRFDLNSIEYAKAGSNLEVRSERVRSVTDEKGRALAFDHRLDELVVELAESAPADRPVKLRFEIDGDFLIRPRGDNYWELGIWPWFPQPTLAGQAYTWHAVVRVPKPFVPFAPGTTVRREDGGRESTSSRRASTSPCSSRSSSPAGTTWRRRSTTASRSASRRTPSTIPRGRKQLTKVAAEIIAYYREFLGPFPFPEFNILEINDYGFGQAPPATMFITKEAFDPLVGDMSRFEAQEIAKIFAHEIAHQYWGIVVRIPSAEEQWLAESVLRVLRFPVPEGPAEPRRRARPRKALAPRGRLRRGRGADPARQPSLGLPRRPSPRRDPQRPPLLQGPDSSRGPAPEDGRRGLSRGPRVDAEHARLEVRHDEADRGRSSSLPAPPTRCPSSREVLLGRRDAEQLRGGLSFRCARVAELADARDLGSRGVKPLRVRIPPLAPSNLLGEYRRSPACRHGVISRRIVGARRSRHLPREGGDGARLVPGRARRAGESRGRG